ncbi:MAG: hypothetical protein ABSD92_01380 [Candidatus Bathyarchaeia archaeon]|jgi:hypothetical protein
MSKDECAAPAILMCSEEAFRMYTTLCAGAKEEKEDNKRRKTKEKAFSSRTPAFFLAAAIGIVNEKSFVAKREKELTRREYILDHSNFGPFEQLIKSKYDLKTESEIVNKLLEFQEYGIRELYDEYHKLGKINFLRIYRDAKTRA